MIKRVQTALNNGNRLSSGQSNFMQHELTEIRLVKLGIPQDIAHEMVMEGQGKLAIN